MPSVSDFAVESDVWPHIASPGQRLQGGWPSRLDFCCKVTTKIFGIWLYWPILAVIVRCCSLFWRDAGIRYCICVRYGADNRFCAVRVWQWIICCLAWEPRRWVRCLSEVRRGVGGRWQMTVTINLLCFGEHPYNIKGISIYYIYYVYLIVDMNFYT